MLEVFLDQGKRLFSSKLNGGKQVPRLTDRLHAYKQILLLLSMVFLLGYSQFRDHFKCQNIPGVDRTVLTNFCWTNGTLTVIDSSLASLGDTKQRPGLNQSPVAHTGLGFTTSTGHRVINHNYMHSIWALIILLAVLSYFAQRKWAQLFDNVVLQALLKLTNSNESSLVRAAESARFYELLSDHNGDHDDDHNISTQIKKNSDKSFIPMVGGDEKVSRAIDIVENQVNIHDHHLDYYPNQLTYLLLTKNSTNYKMSCLKLRSKLIKYSVWSTFASILQFITPLVFIGWEYGLYGWHYIQAFVKYLLKFFTSRDYLTDNSIDYDLSGRIFPIATTCRYQAYGSSGPPERSTVLCTVGINEICSKLFAVIWWFVAISILIDVCSLLILCMCALSSRTTSSWYGLNYWPSARAQANLIASFRHRRAMLLKRRELIKRVRATQKKPFKLLDVTSLIGANKNTKDKQQQVNRETTRSEKKRLEAEGGGQQQSAEANSQQQNSKRLTESPKEWYLWCPRDICTSMANKSAKLVCCRASSRRENLEQEPQLDLNVYYLFYLLYLRLDSSKSKVEEIILMTERALGKYLADLELECDELAISQEKIDEREEEEQENEQGNEQQSTSGGVENISLTNAAKKIQSAMMMC